MLRLVAGGVVTVLAVVVEAFLVRAGVAVGVGGRWLTAVSLAALF